MPAAPASVPVGEVQAAALVSEAATHVYRLFKEHLPDHLYFHNYQHTVEVANATVKIGGKSGLDAEDLALVTLAAWFHDTGFTETYDDHEEASVRIATAFLESRALPPDKVAAVATLIRATRQDHEPQTLSEQVIRDADIYHVGKKNKFFAYARRLRREWEHHRGEPYSDLEWAEIQQDFLNTARFTTPYARDRYEETRARNLRTIRNRLARLLEADAPIPPLQKKTPGRGIETLFRTAYRNHINLSAIADRKANLMISINAILLSIIVSFVSARLQADPWLLIPSAAMLVTSLTAIIFAILSARPKVTSQYFTLEDVRRSRANILFFGNFVNLPRDVFRTGMKEIMEDWDQLYDSMINDLHSLGQVLHKKYRLLWISFTVFMAGLIVTALLFLVLFLMST